MTRRLGLGAVATFLLFACASSEDADGLGGPDPGREGSTPPTFADASSDCKTNPNQAGCPCNATAAAACWTVPDSIHGTKGCKDGTHVCERRGEFSTWGPCQNEVTVCAGSGGGGSDGGAGGDGSGGDGSIGGGSDAASDDGGGSSTPPDYAKCAALPTLGKRGYGTCGFQEVLVIVNDGDKQEMTCCPIGPDVLSTTPGEQNLLRTGGCLVDEVGTGMQSPSTPAIYCTKLNVALFQTAPSAPAMYVTKHLPGALGVIADAYNDNDTCVCPDGSVVFGNHTPKDNVCTDQCVLIQKR
jgi:hypothetical protein